MADSLKTDEMAAEEYAHDVAGMIARCEGVPIDGIRCRYAFMESKDAYLAGCKYKTEQLSNGSVSFDEEAVLEEAALACFGQRDATRCVSHNFIKVARWQHAQLAPIINAQAERLKVSQDIMNEKNRIIAAMDLALIEAGVNFDFSKVDERLEKVRKGEG